MKSPAPARDILPTRDVAEARSQRGYWALQLVLGWINLTLTAPIVYLYVGLPLVLRQHGWSGTDIGLLQLAGLPAIFKFLLAAPIDRYPGGRIGYRNWGIGLALAYSVALLWFAETSLDQTSRLALFLLAVGINLLGTWTDVPVNSLAIRYLPESQRLRAGAIRSAATSLGAIAGGGIMLLLYARFGWAVPLRAMALAILSGFALLLLLRLEPQAVLPRGPTLRHTGWRAWKAYFYVPAFGKWAILMLLYFPFVGSVWVYLKPLLLDSGLSTGQIAMVVGILGGIISAISSLATAHLTRRFGVARMLSSFAWLNMTALLMLLLLVLVSAPAPVLVAMAMILAVAVGASSGLLFGVMMYFIRPGLAALDYGIQSSLFILTRTLMPAIAGILIDHTGYAGMLGFLVTGALIIAWITTSWRQSFATVMTASSRK